MKRTLQVHRPRTVTERREGTYPAPLPVPQPAWWVQDDDVMAVLDRVNAELAAADSEAA